MEKKSPIICFCNNVDENTVAAAIHQGAQTLAEIYDKTQAGSGPCGGSCREKIKALMSAQSSKTIPPIPSEEQPNELIEGISLFNRRFFWEAHEVLEHIWLEEHGPRKKFYQGIIQAAACFYHVLNANPKGVVKLSQDAREKLEAYRPQYMGVELDLLCERLETFHNESREIMSLERQGFSYELLPKIRIGSEMEL